MNGLIKYLILSTIVICFLNTAYGANSLPSHPADLNAWDANGVRHANKGEDVNLIMPAAWHEAAGGLGHDINGDNNYLIALRYGTTYLDINVTTNQAGGAIIGYVAGGLSNQGDANVYSMNLTGSTGPCAVGGDANGFELNQETDNNTFNIQFTVPSSGGIDAFVGREVTVELWRLAYSTRSGSGLSAMTCVAVDANSPFIIGPAIIVRTPNPANSGNTMAKIEQNIAVIGFGFHPTGTENLDHNVTISIYDANLTKLNAHTVLSDLNIYDSAMDAVQLYHQGPVGDTNDAVRDANGVFRFTSDWNGITVYPDANGEFDINFLVPYVTDGTPGRTDLNILRAETGDSTGDANADVFVIAPKIQISGDINVTVTISGNDYNILDAIEQNLFSNWEAVPNVVIRMGNVLDYNSINGSQINEVVIKFNSDVNLVKAAVRNYSDLNNEPVGGGRAEIDVNVLPEFNLDANIYLYEVAAPSSTVPYIIKDNTVCATWMCKNQSGTSLDGDYADPVTGQHTWKYNSADGDGNLAFRVSNFSVYETGSLSIRNVSPGDGEKIRAPRMGVDGNYRFSFDFTDQNTADLNHGAVGARTMQATIYYSDYNAATTAVIIHDTNLYDNRFIRCNGYTDLVKKSTLSGWHTCVFDMNRGDLNQDMQGEFIIDVNVAGPFNQGSPDGIIGTSVVGTGDNNVFFNPPLIEIVDVNLNSENFTIDDYKNAIKYSKGLMDINYVVDFNIYLPDVNNDNNYTLADYNIQFYLGWVQQDVTSNDLNQHDFPDATNSMFDQSFGHSTSNTWTSEDNGAVGALNMSCTPPPAAFPEWDHACTMQFDTNFVFEGKYYLVAKIYNKTARAIGVPSRGINTAAGISWRNHRVDLNELWDINSTIYNFSVNDGNVPRASRNLTTSTTSSQYTMNMTCDDNTSGTSNHLFRDSTVTTWIDRGTTSSQMFSISSSATLPITKTYYGGCKDYAGNISDINITHTVTFEPGGGGGTTPTGPSGPSGNGGTPPPTEPVTVTVLDETITEPPTEGEIESVMTSAGATEEEIAAAKEASGKTEATRNVAVDKTTDTDGAVSYKSTMTVTVKNPGAMKMRNVVVVEDIPKNVADSALLISSDYQFTVLLEDPIIEFTIDEILPNGEATVTYSVDDQVTEGVVDDWTPTVTASLAEVEPCEGVTCPDKACQTGTCNTTTGLCEYTNKADGLSCGTGMECEAGECVETAAPPAPPTTPEVPVDYTWVIALVVILIIVGAGYYLVKGKKSAAPAGLKK